MKKYSRVTYAQRCQISALMQANLPVPKIAAQLGFHKSTIYREIKRNTSNKPNSTKWEYHPLRAQGIYLDRKKRCRRKIKIDPETVKRIEHFLYLRWSPELIAGRLKREKVCKITFQTIYRFIKRNPIYAKYLHYYGRKRFQYKRTMGMAKPGWWKSIDERPNACKERKRIGDWERDTMFGKDRKQALLVCNDRKSRLTKVAIMNEFTSEIVAKKTIELTAETGKKPKTMTNDNGAEFKSPSHMPVQVYYCHPHRPQERGTVENTIGVIRRFLPKKTDLTGLNVHKLESWLNHRPRKVLDFKTPHEVYYGVKVALAT